MMLGPRLKQYIVVAAVNLASISAGLGYGWPSPALVKLTNGTAGFAQPITAEDGSWLVSLPGLVSIFPHFIAAAIMDSIGRKPCIIITSILKTLACVLQTLASEQSLLLAARAALGALDGVLFCAVPAYASEVADKEIRGALGAVLNISVTLGMVLLLSAGPFISYWHINLLYTLVTMAGTVPLLYKRRCCPPPGKEIRGALGAVLNISVTLGMVLLLSAGPFISYWHINLLYTLVTMAGTLPLFFLPESPYFLHAKGRKEESVNVLTFLRGSKELANAEMLDYSALNNIESNLPQMIKNPLFIRSSIITGVLSVIGQLVCHNCIMAYLQTILDSTDTTVKPEMASAIVGCIGLVASCCTLFTDKFGRKPILIGTHIGSGFSLLALGCFFELKSLGHAMSGVTNYVPVISLVIFFFCQSAGFASVYMIVIAELFDDTSRATGMSIALTASSITVFITSKYFSAISSALGPGVYWICAGFSFITTVFVGVWIPETKGKSFREIQECLGGVPKEKESDGM